MIFAKMNVKVSNDPLFKDGLSPKVICGTAQELNMLIKLKKVPINNTLVDVRPFVNSYTPLRWSKQKQK